MSDLLSIEEYGALPRWRQMLPSNLARHWQWFAREFAREGCADLAENAQRFADFARMPIWKQIVCMRRARALTRELKELLNRRP